MAAALRRSAYSTNIKTRQDFSCAFFDRGCRAIAQSFAQPVHLGSFVELIPRAVRAYGPENMGPGDMIVVNDPYSGGSHLNDTTVFAPVFVSPPSRSSVPSPWEGEGQSLPRAKAGGVGRRRASTHGAQVQRPSTSSGRTETGAPLRSGQRGKGPSLRLGQSSSSENCLIGYVAALAHHVDVGGGAPASIGPFQEVYQEGVIIPPVRLVKGGQVVDDIFRLILSQIRSKRITSGDFRAQIAANLAGIRRVNEMVAHFGLDEFNAYVEALLGYTARRTQAEIAKLPLGTFESEGQLDFDGFTDRPVKLSVKITIGPMAGDSALSPSAGSSILSRSAGGFVPSPSMGEGQGEGEPSPRAKSRGPASPHSLQGRGSGGESKPDSESAVLFDLSGCDSQRRAPVNSTYAMTFSACAYALRALMDKDLPINHGFYHYVKLIAPPGTVVNAVHPGAVVGGWETQIRVQDLMFKALSQALPEAVPAGCKAMMAQAGFGVIDRTTGEYHCNYEAIAGGYGGRATRDGPDAVQGHGQNTENAPVEEVETNYPVRITRLSLIEDSDGPGKHRGGLGLRRDYHFPHDPATFTILSDRDLEGPWGLFGGLPGRKAYYILNPDGPSPKQLTSKCVVQLQPGDTVSFQTPGGGGYGDPRQRDPQLVLRDVRDGKVSAQRAQEVYGVACDTLTSRVDENTTNALRYPTVGVTRSKMPKRPLASRGSW